MNDKRPLAMCGKAQMAIYRRNAVRCIKSSYITEVWFIKKTASTNIVMYNCYLYSVKSKVTLTWYYIRSTPNMWYTYTYINATGNDTFKYVPLSAHYSSFQWCPNSEQHCILFGDNTPSKPEDLQYAAWVYQIIGQHWFKYWLVAYSASSHYMNQCLNIVN